MMCIFELENMMLSRHVLASLRIHGLLPVEAIEATLKAADTYCTAWGIPARS